MKKYYKILVTVLVVYIIAVAIAAVISYKSPVAFSVNEEIVLKLNDIAYDCAENWDSLSSLDASAYDVDFIVLDQNNAVRFDSRPAGGESVTIEKAVKSRYPYKYIIRDNSVAGAVIVLDDNLDTYRTLRMSFIIGFAVCGFLIVAGGLIYGIYVNKNIVVPFKRMEQFAGKIAEGNLNEPLLIEENNMFGSFTESFDIMREELDASRKREVALQVKEKELVASLSHDLKTPITGIKLTAELLKATHPDITDKLDNIYKKADEIDVLVTDLFASTLDDLGEFRVNCREESSSVIGEIVAKYDDKGLVRSQDIPGVIINIDAKRLSQVIGNIIYNSYKYANTDINIDYSISEGFLEMRIKDHGPGVPSEELDLITNKFYRGKSETVASSEGSGLGLYIARMLMEKMDGELIPSSDGDGLCILLLIPLA